MLHPELLPGSEGLPRDRAAGPSKDRYRNDTIDERHLFCQRDPARMREP